MLYRISMIRVPGRPRIQAVDEAVRESVQTLLLTEGYRKLSIEKVAAHAGIGKAAIYRRWSTKAEMIFAATFHDLALPPAKDHGSLEADLLDLCEKLVGIFTTPQARQAFAGLMTDLQTEPAFKERFALAYTTAEAARIREILDRAVERGELAPIDNIANIHALLLGTVLAHTLLLDRSSLPGLAKWLTNTVVATLEKAGCFNEND